MHLQQRYARELRNGHSAAEAVSQRTCHAQRESSGEGSV